MIPPNYVKKNYYIGLQIKDRFQVQYCLEGFRKFKSLVRDYPQKNYCTCWFKTDINVRILIKTQKNFNQGEVEQLKEMDNDSLTDLQIDKEEHLKGGTL